MLIIRTLALATVLLFGSTAAFASASDDRSDPKAVKIHKAKDEGKGKDKKFAPGSAPVSVPDGGSTGLLLMIVVAGAGVWSLASARWQQRANAAD